jgi:hypothetical protein
VGIRGLTVVVKSTDRDAAVERYCAILESGVLEEFTIANTGLTVSVLPGVSILSGTAQALSQAESLVATAFVDSLKETEAQLVKAGWNVGGSLGSPNSVLARDADGSMIEFVEQSDR